MIELTPEVIGDRAHAMIAKYQAPKCLEIHVSDDRALTFSHPKYSVIIGIGGIPEFGTTDFLDDAITHALVALTVHLAHEMSTQVWNTRPEWIDVLASTPGGRALAERWLKFQAEEIGKQLHEKDAE